jgi:hypothetical protein
MNKWAWEDSHEYSSVTRFESEEQRRARHARYESEDRQRKDAAEKQSRLEELNRQYGYD